MSSNDLNLLKYQSWTKKQQDVYTQYYWNFTKKLKTNYIFEIKIVYTYLRNKVSEHAFKKQTEDTITDIISGILKSQEVYKMIMKMEFDDDIDSTIDKLRFLEDEEAGYVLLNYEDNLKVKSKL